MAKDYSQFTKNDLIEKVKKLEKARKYGLVWEEKPENVVKQCQNELPVLVEAKEKEIITDSDEPTNILIEGDNYHALSVLNYTHAGKIDFIYIDPPYNTGNNTWKYNNRYVDEEDPFRHSKWISFMNKRLELAKNLIRKDGIICVTIDNYEVHNLRHLLEKIFTDREIIMTVIEHNFRGRAGNNFALTHEYAMWAIPRGKDSITRLSVKSDDIRRNLRRTGQGSRRHESPTLFYAIEVDKNTLNIISATDPIKVDEDLPQPKNAEIEYVLPIDNRGTERRWYYGAKTMLAEAKLGNVYAKRLKDRIEIHYWKPGKEKRRKSVWTDPKYDGSTYGSELLTEIIGENDFPFPKSIYAVMECIEAGTSKNNALILDFFAGSGTTGQAVLELNRKDEGTRKFILCTNNENGICNEITYPRIKNSIKGYKYTGKKKDELLSLKLNIDNLKNINEFFDEIENTKESNKAEYSDVKLDLNNGSIKLFGIKNVETEAEGLGGNLRYFTTDFVPKTAISDDTKYELVNRSTEMICLREDTFNKVMDQKYIKIFKNNNQYTAILFRIEHFDQFKKELEKLDMPINIYVFSLTNDTYDDDFSDLKQEFDLCPIPESILEVYRRIFKE